MGGWVGRWVYVCWAINLTWCFRPGFPMHLITSAQDSISNQSAQIWCSRSLVTRDYSSAKRRICMHQEAEMQRQERKQAVRSMHTLGKQMTRSKSLEGSDKPYIYEPKART